MVKMRPKSIFLDIDGTVFVHHGSLSDQISKAPVLLSGVKEKFSEWESKGYLIILVTGRKESMRSLTEKQLADHGLFFDQLIMGIGGGVRVLINDLKSDATYETAIAVNVERNKGIADVDI